LSSEDRIGLELSVRREDISSLPSRQSIAEDLVSFIIKMAGYIETEIKIKKSVQ
jgi:hypothetical protein